MRLSTFILAFLSLFSLSLAQNWAIAKNCDNEIPKDLNNPEEVEKALRSRDGIIVAMAEARERAKISFKAMSQHADDERVSKICKMVLGDDEEYEKKFKRVRGIFEKIKDIAADPANPGIESSKWKKGRSWDDVEIYCGLDRFTRSKTTNHWINTAWNDRSFGYWSYEELRDKCYNSELKLGDGAEKFKMSTINSEINPYNPKVARTPQPHLPYTIDVCTWFIRHWQDEKITRLNEALIAKVRGHDFRKKMDEQNKELLNKLDVQVLSVIDGLKTMGSTMLHELTHTHLFGEGDTKDTPKGACYNWLCVLEAKSDSNADSIALLGIALELWSMNYVVDEKGLIDEFK